MLSLRVCAFASVALMISWHANAKNQRVSAEVVLARAPVGITEDHVTAYRVMTLGVAIPEDTDVDRRLLQLCASGAVATAAQVMRNDLGLPSDEQFSDLKGLGTVATDLANRSALTVTSYGAETHRRADAIGARIAAIPNDVAERLLKCYGSRAKFTKDQVVAAINLRACPDINDVCRSVANSKTVGLSSAQFEKLYGWLTLAEARRLNQWLSLSADGAWTETAGVVDLHTWSLPPDAAAALGQLEAYVNEFHKNGAKLEKLSYVVPSLTGLSKQSAAHILDVIDHPFAVASLLPDQGGPVFGTISDETARSRVIDCARLRGDTTLEAIQACAGVKLDAMVLASCLNAGSCLPDYSVDAFAASMTITGEETLRDLASNTILPRVGRNVADAIDWEKKASSCFDEHREKDVDAANCLLEKSMAASDYAAVACVRRSDGTIVGKAAILECVAKLAHGAGARIATECLDKAKNSAAFALECGALASAPESVRQLYSCASPVSGGDVQTIISKCASGALSPADQLLAECVAQANDATGKIACLGKRVFPGEEALIGCAAQVSSDWKTAAGCVAAEKIPGDAGKVISCGVKNGGVNLGTAICVAGLDSNLTAEQQIALQCASTDPEPIGFAACTAGMLTLKEFMQCRNAHVGSGQCFGENNEIRKLIRAVGLPDLRENSAAAQILDMQIDVYRFQYAMAEKGVRAAGDFITGAGEALNRLGRSIEDAYKRLSSAASDLYEGAVNAVKACFGLCG